MACLLFEEPRRQYVNTMIITVICLFNNGVYNPRYVKNITINLIFRYNRVCSKYYVFR